MPSSTFTESNITVDLTGRESFQFSSCLGYQTLSAHGFKEMDIGWYEPNASTGGGKLYIAELKDFSIETLAGRRGTSYPSYQAKADFIIDELVRKSIDSACMLAAVGANTPHSAQIQPCLPPSYVFGQPVHLIHILHFSPSLLPYLSFINTKVKARFTGYGKLLNITHCTVLSHSQAMTHLPNIS